MTEPIKTVFFGTPKFSVPILQALSDCFTVAAVVTQPDRPSGRGRSLTSSPVKILADSLEIPVLQPKNARDTAFLEVISSLAPDLILTAAYGNILPSGILHLPRLGCINVHASLLPGYRGAAPINWSLINGDTSTGITMIKMDEGIDTGPILAQQSLKIDPTDNTETLGGKLSYAAAEMLPEFLEALVGGRLAEKPQNDKYASYTPMLTKKDGLVNWHESAKHLHNRIRGLYPWPVAYTYLNGKQLRLLASDTVEGQALPGEIAEVGKETLLVGTSDGLLSITEIQPPGKKPMPIHSFLQGHRLQPGMKMG